MLFHRRTCSKETPSAGPVNWGNGALTPWDGDSNLGEGFHKYDAMINECETNYMITCSHTRVCLYIYICVYVHAFGYYMLLCFSFGHITHTANHGKIQDSA